ncbi:MAG: hypothetical protein IIX96_03460 [Clostridia bacterium]|nr:hypothetical protein [Clostridia bacterium]
MKTKNREILIRTVGMVDALYFGADGRAKDALELIADNLDLVLDDESEADNEIQ